MKKTIYKKDTKDKIRFLELEVKFDLLYQNSGVLNTENIITHIKVCKPKNVGKSNETSGNEQAMKELEAIVKDKLTKGYFETIEDAEDSTVVLPMLAHDYKKHSKKIDWKKDTVFVQPKLDGMRCLKNKDSLMSRGGKKIKNMEHIEKELPHIFNILDGELYVHGEDFQTNMEYIKEYKPGLSEKIQFHVYDLVSPLDFQSRHIILKGIISSSNLFGTLANNIVLVPTYEINSEEELAEYHQKFLEEGYEGTMVRISKSGYKLNGRSTELLKYKDFQDLALPVKDIVPCKNETDWGEIIFDWPGATGHRCGKDILGSNSKMSHEKRREILINKEQYIGKTAEVRFFEYSNKGVPRFPVVVGFRNDK